MNPQPGGMATNQSNICYKCSRRAPILSSIRGWITKLFDARDALGHEVLQATCDNDLGFFELAANQRAQDSGGAFGEPLGEHILTHTHHPPPWGSLWGASGGASGGAAGEPLGSLWGAVGASVSPEQLRARASTALSVI